VFASDIFDDPEQAMDFYTEMQGNKDSLELKLQSVGWTPTEVPRHQRPRANIQLPDC
jgi:hypothetical protein